MPFFCVPDIIGLRLTGVSHCGQHFPGITQTVCPLAAQAGHLRPGTVLVI